MTCREVVEFLSDHLEGRLPPRQRVAFEEHLATCPDCRTYVRTYAETVRLGKAAFRDPDGPLPADLPSDLVQAILAARTRA